MSLPGKKIEVRELAGSSLLKYGFGLQLGGQKRRSLARILLRNIAPNCTTFVEKKAIRLLLL